LSREIEQKQSKMFQLCRFVSSTRFRSAFDDPRIIEKIRLWGMVVGFDLGLEDFVGPW
jgi:hypothetical protein